MKRILLPVFAAAAVLLGASAVWANAGPPQPRPVEPSTSLAAVIGGAGAAMAGLWLVRRPKP